METWVAYLHQTDTDKTMTLLEITCKNADEAIKYALAWACKHNIDIQPPNCIEIVPKGTPPTSLEDRRRIINGELDALNAAAALEHRAAVEEDEELEDDAYSEREVTDEELAKEEEYVYDEETRKEDPWSIN